MTTISTTVAEDRLHCYKIQLIDNHRGQRKTGSGDEKEDARKKSLICSRCSATITSSKEAVRVNGRHEHAFFNPSGIAFEVRTFRQAPGCLVQGDPSTEFSWFPGCSWQYATCSNCLSHLGWYFVAAQKSFFALMTNRVI